MLLVWGDCPNILQPQDTRQHGSDVYDLEYMPCCLSSSHLFAGKEQHAINDCDVASGTFPHVDPLWL
jgi:hypothetical protein